MHSWNEQPKLEVRVYTYLTQDIITAEKDKCSRLHRASETSSRLTKDCKMWSSEIIHVIISMQIFLAAWRMIQNVVKRTSLRTLLTFKNIYFPSCKSFWSGKNWSRSFFIPSRVAVVLEGCLVTVKAHWRLCFYSIFSFLQQSVVKDLLVLRTDKVLSLIFSCCFSNIVQSQWKDIHD